MTNVEYAKWKNEWRNRDFEDDWTSECWNKFFYMPWEAESRDRKSTSVWGAFVAWKDTEYRVVRRCY